MREGSIERSRPEFVRDNLEATCRGPTTLDAFADRSASGFSVQLLEHLSGEINCNNLDATLGQRNRFQAGAATNL